MAKIRRAGFGTVFQIENETVGIGTTANSNTVQVSGNVKSSNVNVIGITTLPVYKGFLDKETKLSSNEVDLDNLVGYVDGQPYYGDFHVHNRSDGTVVNMVGSAHTTVSHQVINDVANLKVDTLSGDIIIDGEFTVSSGTTYCTSVDQLTVTSGFSVPTGTTDDRIHCHTAGSMRFNEDTGTLEFYTGGAWKTVNSFKDTGNRGRSLNVNSNLGATAAVEFCNISTLGNTQYFGDLLDDAGAGMCSSEIRAVGARGGGNRINYFTMASAGNAVDFGNNTIVGCSAASSSSTRGIFVGGYVSGAGGGVNTLSYVQIATTGDALDFGDSTRERTEPSSCTNGRQMFIGGGTPIASDIEVITISSTGNAIDFADAGHKIYGSGSLSNSTRGFFAAGGSTSLKSDQITMFNMQSGGFFTDFGTVRTAEDFYANGTSNATRGIFCGAYTGGPATGHNIIQFITISTAGDTQDFGELSAAAWGCNATSDSHGGLGGL